MSTTDAGATRGARRDDDKTLAQWFCYIVGPVLILAGLLGFIADSTFDTGDAINGDTLLGLEVNGWHNLVHLASGAFLLAMAPKRKTAKTGAIAFGLIYAVVTIIGMADGSDILGLLPVNPADNVLHLALAALSLIAGLTSDADDRHGRREGVEETGTATTRDAGRARAGR
jgi:hypothetical protein